MRPYKRCRACGGTSFIETLFLGQQPLANAFTATPATGPTYPLSLMVCDHCRLGATSVILEPAELFTDYRYMSGVNPGWREHCRELADRVTQGRPVCVLDLASNDGTMLAELKDAGARRAVGVEPARNLCNVAWSRGLETICNFWPCELDQYYDVAIATNVLAHVDSPSWFIRTALLAAQSLWIEVPRLWRLVEQRAFDTIYHEHLSYFSAASLSQLARRSGAVILEAEEVAVHGGSFRLHLVKGFGPCEAMEPFIEEEADLSSEAHWQHFAKDCYYRARSLRLELEKTGRPVICFGASAKSTILLSYADLPCSYIVDDSPTKTGSFSPGRGLSVRPVTALTEEPNDLAILIGSWNWSAASRERVRTLRPNHNDSFHSLVAS